jgi:uncharacterized Zn finger protein
VALLKRRITMSRYRDYYYFPSSSPRKVKGGIRADSKRGAFGKNWWAKRWIAVLESFNMGARLTRGRSYARRGQVISIDIDKGVVSAEVQGSRVKPYQVSIKVKTLSKAKWQRLADILSERAIFAAKLLAGEMPGDIEDAFAEAGLSLFPEKRSDLKTDCSCPDWANPCKHIAAVYYLLGEEFDRDPFLIFKLRGIEREKLVELIVGSKDTPAASDAVVEATPEPLPADPEVFWNAPKGKEPPLGEVCIPSIAAALPKRLGKFPFWRSETNLTETLERIYRTASPVGLDIVLGERGPKEKE